MEKSRRLCDSWLSSFLKYTEGTESSTLFYLWSGITVIAVVLDRKVYLNRGILDPLYPNFYTILVGPSGCRKGPPIIIASRFLREVDGINIIHGRLTVEGLIRQLAETGVSTYSLKSRKKREEKKEEKRGEKKEEEEEEKREEKKEEKEEDFVLDESKAFLMSSELRSMFGTSYAEDLMVFLTDAWNCESHWSYTTKIHGKTDINNTYLNFLGASNPEWLAKSLSDDAFGGGFMGRVISVFQDTHIRVAHPQKTPEQQVLENFLKIDLQHIALIKGEFKFNKEALAFYDDWYNNFTPDYSGRKRGYLERKGDHILKLAMILSISEDDDLVIEKHHIEMAQIFLKQVEDRMDESFVYIATTNEAKVAQRIIETITANNGVVGHQKIVAKIRHMIKNLREFIGIVETLESAGILKRKLIDNKLFYMFTDEYIEVQKGLGETTITKIHDVMDVADVADVDSVDI